MKIKCTRRGSLVWTAVLFVNSIVFPIEGQSVGYERSRAKTILKQVSKDIEKNFYDPELRGLNWKELTDQTRERIEGADSVNEMLTAIFTLVDKLQDSHTVFLPPERVAKPQFGFTAKAFGQEIRINELSEDGRAAMAGLRLGDRILVINGYRAERNNFDLLMLYLRLLRPVSVMEITFSRGDERQRTVRVEANIKNSSFMSNLTEHDTVYRLIREAESNRPTFHYMSSKDEIGFLQLPYFPADKKFLRNLVKKIDDSIAVVIDLRGNPGGAIDGLEYFTGFFESEPVTVANMVGRKKTEALKVKPQKPNLAGPLFILVDSQSMSSSEVFARHFQRTEQAVVIGDRTPGRATAARIFNHSLGAQRATLYGAQVAVSRLVFPDGEELEGRGVIPDQICIPSEEHLKNADDPCLQLAQALAEQAIGLKGSDLILAMAYKEIGRDEEALHALEEAAIIEAGVDKNTALMHAAKTGNAETIQALLDEGANANAKDEDGTTVLMYAAAWGVWPNLQVLLEAGADIHAKDKDGKTALMIAEGAGHTEIVELLKKVGAKE